MESAIQMILLCLYFCNLFGLCNSADSPPFNFCPDSKNIPKNGSFKQNLVNLLTTLSFQSSTSRFYKASSSGNDFDPERVYGLFLCYDYVPIQECRSCVSNLADGIRIVCGNSEDAIMWGDICQLRYAKERFFGHLSFEGNTPKNNTQIVRLDEQVKYKSIVRATLRALARQAAFSLSAQMYATSEAPFFQKTIYAYVQCTLDLSADDCHTCLQKAILDSINNFKGTRLLSRSCYLRYELYPLYNKENDVKPAAANRKKKLIAVTLIIGSSVVFLGFGVFCLLLMIRKKRQLRISVQEVQIHEQKFRNIDFLNNNLLHGWDHLHLDQDLPFIDMNTINEATANFSESNMLGQGGFGPVYKGVLPDGEEVAIKRLSSCSQQGLEEFASEVLLIFKLQHKNLVRLLGFCVHGAEKLLIYEYMPNSSLDCFLFDSKKRVQLSWNKRLNIIHGIAQGMLYLHQDSRLRIIHRDLKPSNVLLDKKMNPKISDFGTARIFGGNDGENNSSNIVGTFGYMAPEFAMEGLYSIKSDVFSFGVLVLEIITGRRNVKSGLTKRSQSLLAYAWQLWEEKKGLELMDPLLSETCPPDEFLRLMQIGLVCVQQDPYDRPTMSSVVISLKGSKNASGLCEPGQPGLAVGRFNDYDICDENLSVSNLTISTQFPR